MKNEKIDKFGILLLKGHYNYIKGNKEYNKHIHPTYGCYGCKITVSSRALLNKDKLPDISINIMSLYPSIIKRATNIQLSTDVLLNAPLYWLDICSDVTNDTDLNTKDFISILREKAYQKKQ